MKGYVILLLLCCSEVMGALSRGSGNGSDVQNTTQGEHSRTTLTATISKLQATEASSLWEADSSTTRSTFTISHITPTSTRSQINPNPPKCDCMFDRKTEMILLMVSGGLIILCTILLISTLALAWRVCQLKRHIHGGDADLISNSEYWIGTAKGNRGKPGAEAKETSVLMSDLTQNPEETNASPAEEEEGKVNKDAGTEKEEGVIPSSDQASANGFGKETAGSASSLSPKPPVDEPVDVV